MRPDDAMPFQKYNGVMTDLETLSTRPDAVIVSIGACKFSYQIGIYDQFKINVSGKSGHAHGLHICKDTVEWWSKQSKAAKDAWVTDSVSLEEGMAKFTEWWADDSLWFYCNGLSFDAPILRTSLDKVGLKQPWKYRNEMDLRTKYNMVGYDRNRRQKSDLLYHDALQDAIFQTKELLEMFGVDPF
jgi:hypothetical protein